MESSALFSIASLYKVEIAALFTISDSHAHLEWKPSFEETMVQENLYQLFETAKAVLTQHPGEL